ncbi:uncharacterized protein EAE97_004929 [Botrytis byssoidea]|uniref:Uncharacterized protein n=1 Tax=Botrytis byssoidea TaxID=139641 RepID=A0A9P5M0C3_9HELO|nr:uncharacterized protein EAE97_004929 [Botrytis byssoidea]KAF7945891.1 hypothetical protein EAE97_004929 [Botrytis byssoidea]
MSEQVESFFKPEDLNDIPVIPQSVVVSDRHDKPSFSVEESHQLNTSESESLKGWRNEMILSAMKHFNMNILDAEEWAKHLPVPSNISATTGPTDQAETSPHPKVENKPQEIEHGKVYHGYQGESSSQYEYYEALERESSCEIPELLNFMPEMGYIPSAIHSPASPEHILVESDSAKSQNHQIDAVLGSSMGKETSFGGFGVDGPRMEESDGYSASPACSPVSPAYSCIEADSSQIQADKTSSSFMGDKKRLDNSKFMDESVTTNNWHLTEEKKMSPSSLKYIPSKSNDLMGHHDYDTDLTKQTSLSSQVASYLDRGNLDASITQTRHTLNQINNADPSKCLPPKRELDPHYISDLRDLTAHDCTDAFNNEEQDGSPLDEHEAWVQRNREERRRRRRSSATVQKRSLAGHEVQLILLKDQNKRRQEIAKLGQQNSCQQLSETSHQANLESALPKLNVPANELAYLDDQSQLVLIKKENEDRLALTRQVQRIQNAMLPSNSVAPNPQPETSRADDILFTGKKSADSPYSKPNLFGIPTQLSPVDPSFAQSEQFVQVNNSSCTTPGVILQTNQKYTAIQTWPSHGTQQQHQKLQSSIQRTQRIQMQQQQQKQMVRLSPHRRLGVTERVAGGDSGRWHNFDACLSMEISANMPSVLHGLGTENLLPKTQPQEVQMLNRASQETYIRDGQPSYPSISPYGKSEPRGRMELPPGYTDDLSGQVFKSSKIDRSNNDSILNFQNEVSNKGPGGFWIRGFINVKSLDAVMWSNLEQYLKWQRVYATSEAGSIPLVANSDWFANLYKERIALRRQMFPRAASCIQKILDVLAVMEETIGLKIGAIAWACLLGAVENLLSYGTNWTVDSQTRIITEMSEIASIIARYTVMENIYSQWKGMSLDKDYEQSLINLSTHVLIYLGAFVPSLSESSTNADMKPYFEKIIEADTACREFTVIVSSNNNDIDRKRLFEEFSDDSDDTVDSDGTILGVDGNEQVNDTPSSAKRTKI